MNRWRSLERSGATGLIRHVCSHTILTLLQAKTKLILVAKQTPQEEGADEDADEQTPPQLASPAERFLQKDSDDLWELGPLPDLGTVRHADLGIALHVYVTQQWSMGVSILSLELLVTVFLTGLKKGSKRVMWKGITDSNSWYISKEFRLRGEVFGNPTRLPESVLRAFWRHWYKLSQSGKPFTFKRTSARDEDAGNTSDKFTDEDLPKPDMPEEEEETTKKSGSEEEEDKDQGNQPEKDAGKSSDLDEELLTPDGCYSNEQKITFLHSLGGTSDRVYQAIIDILAQMAVSSHLIVNLQVASVLRRYPGWQ